MSKYQKYAKELDKAFTSAAKEYGDAWSTLQKAKESNDNAPKKADDRNEYKKGDNEVIRIRLKANLEEAEMVFEQKEKEVWKNFQKTLSQIDKEFHEELREDGILKVDGLDEKGMVLLNSGLMGVDDLRNMADEYAGNVTMLKMIAKTASEAAEKAKTDDERQSLTMIAHDIGDGKSPMEQGWDTLCHLSNVYSGQNHGVESRHGDYVTAMNDHWNDKNVRDMIDNF